MQEEVFMRGKKFLIVFRSVKEGVSFIRDGTEKYLCTQWMCKKAEGTGRITYCWQQNSLCCRLF